MTDEFVLDLDGKKNLAATKVEQNEDEMKSRKKRKKLKRTDVEINRCL